VGAEPTHGYRRVYQALYQRKIPVGRERVRRLIGKLGLQLSPLMKKKRPARAVLAKQD